MKLDEKALEAARRAFANGEKFSDQLPSAIRAYLSTAAPPDVAGLIAELADENFRHEMQHLRSSAEIDRLFQQAATALRLSAGGGWRTMDSAPKDGKHCVLAIYESDGFVWTASGAFQNGQWNSVLGDNVNPLYWMPPTKLPDNWQDVLPASPTVESGSHG